MAYQSAKFLGIIRQISPRRPFIRYQKALLPQSQNSIPTRALPITRTISQSRFQSTIPSVKIHSDYPALSEFSSTYRVPQNTEAYGYNPKIHHNPPSDFTVRPATSLDAPALTSLWFNSLTPTPSPSLATISWWNKVWTVGISLSPHAIQTYVVIHNPTKQIVAFSRWQLPNQHGAQNTYLPDFPPEWDAGLTEALWGGVSKTRAEVMGNRPHWMGEFLAIHPEYKGQGLGSMLVDWGCKQADAAGLEIYGDATVDNRMFFSRRLGFEYYKSFDMSRKGGGVVGIVRKPVYTGGI
ncbi:hypothetical protein TWF506_004855 [Arthrobotrys conoides]|uniref:N-acetyltransferase domain-containing protein n=1 Tax=Arthrobotrys conoides TaxID=74498 RepID=A0AAN8PNR6_9PEZI